MPGPIVVLFGILVGIADWAGFVEFYRSALEAIGGLGLMVLDLLQSPAAALLPLVAGSAYIVFFATAEEGSSRAHWLPVVGWGCVIAMYVILIG